MTNFMHLLDKKVSETERPKPLPVGAYDMVITGYTTGTSQQKQTPYVEFALKVLSPRDDVDPEEWAQVKNPTEAKLKTQFYLTEDSMCVFRTSWPKLDLTHLLICLTPKCWLSVQAETSSALCRIDSPRMANQYSLKFASS